MKRVLLIMVILSGYLLSQDLNGIKLYINPGHGGHDPANDRFISATGFWESDGNLAKGLYVRDMLQNLGATVIMSRTQNRDQDDRALSAIVADANANNVDYFHSIHSNAVNAKTNYVLILYQGFDTKPTYSESRRMAGYLYDEIAKAHRLTSHYSGQNLRGDFDFYGTGAPYLGVFKGLAMPGTLSEGSFHDYIPESWRLMNDMYRKHEAWAISRGFLQFYSKPGYAFGEIAGIVRDPDQTVDYYATPSYNESKKPLNNIKVTLQPGNRVYEGDPYNNGFFMFDSLMPGEYKVIYERAGYYKDSTTVNVIANGTVFADKFMNYDTTLAPSIVSRVPAASSSRTIDPVVITFDRKMSHADVEGAFSISPSVPGTFSWGEDRILVFTPSIPMLTTTKYTVTLSTGAKSKWGVPLASEYTFAFTTNNRRKMEFEKSYPDDYSTEISTTVQFRIQFDKPIGSAGGQVFLYDNKGTSVAIAGAKLMSENDKGIIYFEPKVPLQPYWGYKVVILGGLEDLDGYPLLDTLTINFVTSRATYISGVVVDSFETVGKWKNPGWGTGTTGVDTLTSSFRVTYSKKLFGGYSARLAYTFTQNNDGICQFYNTSGFDINAGASSEFGSWIWSDLSNNLIEYWFNSDGNTVKVAADTLNWSGWKLCSIPLSTVPGSAKKFNSIVIKQTAQGLKSSIIYVDDAQYDIVLPVEENKDNIPSVFSLDQNYPNPFNPSTKIRFSIPQMKQEVPVRLSIFNILGKEVALLVNDKRASGTYEVDFSAVNLPSGIYIYKLQYGSNTLSRKMMLLK